MIAAASPPGRGGPVAILGNRFMLFIGYLTYSLYLWHWPLLIVAREHFGSISLRAGLAIMVFTIVPAYLTFHLVENPLRSSRLMSAHPRASRSASASTPRWSASRPGWRWSSRSPPRSARSRRAPPRARPR